MLGLIHVSGLAGVGGFVSSSHLRGNEPRGRMTVTFGAHGFFGYGACTVAPQSNHFAECTAPAGDEAAWWSTYECSELPDTRNFDKDDILRQLKVRHAGWADPVVQRIVDGAVINSIYPTWITPELPTWHTRGLVLIGDAAHAMQPSSGQGTSQGFEDAQVFSMLLAHHLERHFSQSASRVERQIPASVSEAVDQASKEYFELRRPRVKRIVDRAKQMGDTKRKKGLVEEYLTYLILWIIGQYLWLLRLAFRGIFRTSRRITDDIPGLLPVDTYTKQVYNDLPIYEVQRVIEADKSPAVKPVVSPS